MMRNLLPENKAWLSSHFLRQFQSKVVTQQDVFASQGPSQDCRLTERRNPGGAESEADRGAGEECSPLGWWCQTRKDSSKHHDRWQTDRQPGWITLVCLPAGITGFKSENLKPTETVEKVVLPGKEEIKTEKTIKGVLEGVKGFESEKLKNVKTKEPASPIAVAQVIKLQCELTYINIFFSNRRRKLASPVWLLWVILTEPLWKKQRRRRKIPFLQRKPSPRNWSISNSR